ncbi:DUF6402 family protein [Psychroserpens sp. NJDZ02]|uniref:DUF6402 family protein n=1 Tax=Psychroserpens sp. NJDZ02 TaxID=2570561 RepID=UPI0010A7DDDE|nr:DUF6402 family protein [Psychroserpens sp. NJDZ02]QCE40497.1 hypothetical protein E9099_03390 [Psychroserpens sp. NJDZ02]
MVLKFEQDKIKVTFTTEEEVKATTYTVKVFAKNKSDGGSEQHVYTSPSYTIIKKKENIWFLVIDYMFYNAVAKKIKTSGKPLPNIIDFSFKILINETESEVSEIFSIHFVRYMAQLMDVLKWKNAAKLQRLWFTKGCNNEKKNVPPEIDFIDINWVFNISSHAKIICDNFHKGNLMSFKSAWKRPVNEFFTPIVKNSFKTEIKDQIEDKEIEVPNENNTKTTFGSFDLKKVKDKNGEKMPLIEKYYFNSHSFGGDGGKDGVMHILGNGLELDDLLGSLANFNFRVAAQGHLIYENNTVNVNIKKLLYYIKDNFDYVGDEQELGYWSIGNEIRVRAPELGAFTDDDEFYNIKNKDFSDYRNDVGLGYDFHVYSTIHTIDVSNKNIKFDLYE